MLSILTVPEYQNYLKLKSQHVSDFAIAAILVEMMREVTIGKTLYGLSAIQVGYADRIFIMDITGKEGKEFSAFINPEIRPVKTGNPKTNRSLHWEACASIPEKIFLVERWNEVILSGKNEKEEDVVVPLKGIPARIAQHENDHLNGILISMKGKQAKELR